MKLKSSSSSLHFPCTSFSESPSGKRRHGEWVFLVPDLTFYGLGTSLRARWPTPFFPSLTFVHRLEVFIQPFVYGSSFLSKSRPVKNRTSACLPGMLCVMPLVHPLLHSWDLVQSFCPCFFLPCICSPWCFIMTRSFVSEGDYKCIPSHPPLLPFSCNIVVTRWSWH